MKIFQVPYGHLLMLFFGVLIYRLMSTVHEIDAPFCERCWRRYRLSNLIWPLVVVTTVLFIVIGVYCSAVYKTDEPFSYLIIAASLLVVIAFVVRRYLRPRVILVTEEIVKIKVPHEGVLTINQSNASGLLGLGLGDNRKDR